MRSFRLAALTAVLALAACGSPVEETNSATSTSTTTNTSTTGHGPTSTTTSAGTTEGNASTTSAGTSAGNTSGSPTSTSSTGTTVVTTGGTSAGTGSTGDTAGTNAGTTEGAASTTSTTNGGTNEGTVASSTTGTGGTSASTGGVNCCSSDADCAAQWGTSATCVNGSCYVTGPNNGTIGGCQGTSNIGSTTGTTGTSGTTCATPCQTSADCPADPNATTVTCEANGTCSYIDSFPSTGGTGGGGICPTTGGTTGSSTCSCNVDSDCNDQNHQGYVCTNGTCEFGPNIGAVSSTGGQCANQGSSTTSTTGTSSTTGTTTSGGGNGGPGCECATDVDCQSPYWENLSCVNGTCQFGTDAAAASTGGRSCNSGGNNNTTSTTGGGTTSAGNTTGGGASTPLVLSFDGASVDFTQTSGHFELGQGDAKTTDWVSARTPWLALDRDGNGRIDSGEELFGSLTKLADGRRAQNGFEALAALDANHDGKLDAKDPAFAKLVLWSDADQDRRSSRGELTSLASAGVVSIDLGYATTATCDARGNCEREHASFVFRGADGALHHGSVVDVHLAHRPVALSQR